MPLRTLKALILWMSLFASAGTAGLAWADSGANSGTEQTVTVFAAASTKPFLDALAPQLKQQGIDLRTVHAGSSVLARQIERGAPADIFISANVRWMDNLTDRGQLVFNSKQIIARNELVLIGRTAPATTVRVTNQSIGPDFPIETLLRGERLAIADPDHVPAGIYSYEALATLKLWSKVKDRLARTQNVTGALMMVAHGEAPLGIVYASDVKRTDKVSLIAHFPPFSHSPIVYPAAIVLGHDRHEVRQVLNLLISPQGQAAIVAAGFRAAP